MKVIIIGCTHAGTSAALNIKGLYNDADVSIYEQNDNISFLSCGIALCISGVVREAEHLFYSSPEALSNKGINTNMSHEVLKINDEEKTIEVKNLITGDIKTDNYDKLIITVGSWPIVPNIKGIHSKNIQLCKNYEHSKDIINKIKNKKKVVVIGAGYIGIELVEAIAMNNIDVTLIDKESRVVSKYLDCEFTEPIEKSLKEHSIIMRLNESVQEFTTNTDGEVTGVVTDKGTIPTDMVILCIGFRPNTDLIKDIVNILPNKAILVDEYMYTSNPDILAAGDCAAVKYNPTNTMEYIPLATNAIRMGFLAAKNLKSKIIKSPGTQGTSSIKIFDLCLSSTGLTEVAAKSRNLDIKTVIHTDNYIPEFMPKYKPATLKLTYDAKSHVLLGAQLYSEENHSQVINTLSVCIQNKMTIEDIALIDQFFLPHFNKPFNLLNATALKALEENQ